MLQDSEEELTRQDILTILAEMMSAGDLNTLLDMVVMEVPGIVRGSGGSVYLVPELVPQYGQRPASTQYRVGADGNSDIGPIVVLAATSKTALDEYVGRAFYSIGDGFAGWVFANGKTLSLRDSGDEQESRTIDPNLKWGDRYGGAKAYYADQGKPKPLLVAPISVSKKTIGVLKIAGLQRDQPFSDDAEKVVETIGRIIGNMIQQNYVMQNHNRIQEQRTMDFLSLSHELNTPLVGLIADAENLLTNLRDADPVLTDEAQSILEHALRLQLMTETILITLSRQTPRRMFTLGSIAEALRDAVQMFQSEAKAKGCEILLPDSTIEAFPLIEMSYFDLTNAFKNIIHNAVKYTFTARADQRRFIRISGTQENPNQFTVKIQNYGVGIGVEELKHGLIFQPYYRGVLASDHRRTGSGLGLAFAKQVIEDLHHGTIELISESQPGGAYLTTVIVTLPRTQTDRREVMPG